MVRERVRHGIPGFVVLPLVPLVAVAAQQAFLRAVRTTDPPSVGFVLAGIALIIIGVLLIRGFFMVAPNEAQVLQLFGSYAGTAKTPGLRWANPFYTRKKISLRVRNFESSHLKVNDQEGNPIEIAAVVVWHALRRYRQQRDRPDRRFRMTVTIGNDAVATIAIAWQIFAISLVPLCP